jgi:hypothetical protein
MRRDCYTKESRSGHCLHGPLLLVRLFLELLGNRGRPSADVLSALILADGEEDAGHSLACRPLSHPVCSR